MEIAVGIILFVIFGIIIAKLARFIGSEIFKFSIIYNFYLKLFKNMPVKKNNS